MNPRVYETQFRISRISFSKCVLKKEQQTCVSLKFGSVFNARLLAFRKDLEHFLIYLALILIIRCCASNYFLNLGKQRSPYSPFLMKYYLDKILQAGVGFNKARGSSLGEAADPLRPSVRSASLCTLTIWKQWLFNKHLLRQPDFHPWPHVQTSGLNQFNNSFTRRSRK